MNKVTAFERPDATSIFVEWWDDEGRHREALSTVAGAPVTDREKAKEVVKRMSKAQEVRRNLTAYEALGLVPAHAYTLKQLLDRRHSDLSPTWSEKYTKSRKLRRKFWLKHLGGSTKLVQISPALVERIARREQKGKSERWVQDVIRFLRESFAYAEKKLKWIEPKHNLQGVDLPRAPGKSKAYTAEEGRALVRSLYTVHPVAGWMGSIAYQTGRRLNAIRTLRQKHVERDGDRTLIHFPGSTDKARRSGTAVVYNLPERTDWEIPSQETCNEWIHQAEVLAGIEHVDGRAWHGIKRLYATLAANMEGADLQAGTLRSTLVGRYRQDTLGPKDQVAKALAERLGDG